MSKPVPEPGVIEVRVASLAQVFNSFDPSPFHERDLDQSAEEFVIDWAREIPRNRPITIKLCLPQAEADTEDGRNAPAAIANHFERSADSARRQMREHFRLGWRYLAMGVAILALCLTASEALHAFFPNGPFVEILREGLIIIGWVANWKPLEIFLYDWQPIKRRLTLYTRLAVARIELVAG